MVCYSVKSKFTSQNILGIWVCFLGCYNKISQTWWLKTTRIYFLTVVEARSPQTRCWQSHNPPLRALGEHPSLPLPASGRSRSSLACGSLTPISSSVFTWLLLRTYVSNLPLLSLIRILISGFQPILHPGWSHFEIHNLLPSAKIRFPKKATFTGTGG